MDYLPEILEYIIAQRESGATIEETVKETEEQYRFLFEGEIKDVYLGLQKSTKDQVLYLTLIDKGLLTVNKTQIIFD